MNGPIVLLIEVSLIVASCYIFHGVSREHPNYELVAITHIIIMLLLNMGFVGFLVRNLVRKLILKFKSK